MAARCFKRRPALLVQRSWYDFAPCRITLLKRAGSELLDFDSSSTETDSSSRSAMRENIFNLIADAIAPYSVG